MDTPDTHLDVAAFVTDWLSLDQGQPTGGARHYDASTQLTLQRFESPDVAWLLVGLLAACTADPRLLASLGAGPLEDLLAGDPLRFIPLAVTEARSNAGIRTALGSVWLCRHEVPEALLALLEAEVPGFTRLPDCGCEGGV